MQQTCTAVQISLARKHRQCRRPCSDTDQACTGVHPQVHGRALPWLSRPTPACSELTDLTGHYCTGVHFMVHGRALSKIGYKPQKNLLINLLSLGGSCRNRKQAKKDCCVLLWSRESTLKNPLIQTYHLCLFMVWFLCFLPLFWVICKHDLVVIL